MLVETNFTRGKPTTDHQKEGAKKLEFINLIQLIIAIKFKSHNMI